MNEEHRTVFRCVRCRAPLEGAEPGLAIRCGHCNTEQLVESDSDSEPPSAGPGAIDFDALHQELSNDPVEWHERVWAAAFWLESWQILVFPSSDEPVQAEVQGESWLFVCTDTDHSRAVASQLGVIDPSGNPSVVTMSPERAVRWMLAWSGGSVHGVRFNEGRHSWSATFDELPLLSETHALGGQDEPMDDDEAIRLLRRYLDAAEIQPFSIEIDEENTDDERVYLHVIKEVGGLERFCVEREQGRLQVFRDDEGEWAEVRGG